VGSLATTVKQGIKRQVKWACAGPLLRRKICWRVSRPEPLVAITFDDGPNTEETPLVLDILETWHAPATFFLQGNHVEQHPETVQRIARAGHEIGNHGYDHSKRDLRRQVQQCDRALQRLGITTRLFRPPGGALGMSDLLWLMREGYSTVMWSLDAVDSMREEGKWHGEAPDYSVVAGGDIVLMHDDNAACLRDLPGLLETLTRKQLRPELVSRLIE
jgi:peptidoglycan/xylan/chitin deacetylase (PgdA/CDA1 family)